MTIRSVSPADCGALADIYNYYIANTIVTFEETAVSAAEMGRRVDDVRQASLPWLVATNDERVVGYAYASPWKSRSGYRFSVEATVYLHPDATGQGIGSALYRELFAALRARGGVHAVMGGIALPNDASIALHEKAGMTRVASFSEVGYKFDRWIDVAYWQIIL